MMNFRRVAARRLRTNQTAAEVALWRLLKRIETRGTHFRRQVPIGRYIADFAFMTARLVIEIDGSQHGEELIRSRDDRRTRWLEAAGYRVLRFWNNDVIENPSGVLQTVHAAIYGNAEPAPLKHLRRRRDHPTPAR
jgi:very-short-patch-repair endonuclease